MAAGHPALAWPDRWAESWAAVGAVVEALVWWVGTSQAVICPPPGRASGSSPCSPWREPPTEVASESQRSWVKAHSSWLCGQVWGLVAGECSAAPSRLSQGRGGVPLGQGRKGEAPSPLEVRTENWASEQLVLGEREEARVVRGEVGKGCRAEPRRQQLAGVWGWGSPGSRDRKLQLDGERRGESWSDEAGKTSS